MSIAKYLPWNPMSHHFSYAALTLCLRFPSFGLREGNCQETLTRSLRRSHWIIFDSRSTTRAYAKSLTCYVAVSSEKTRKKMTKNETDWAHEASSRENSVRNSRLTASRTLGQSAHVLHKTLERFRSWRHGLWVKVRSFAYEWLTQSLRGNLFFYNTEHTKKRQLPPSCLRSKFTPKSLRQLTQPRFWLTRGLDMTQLILLTWREVFSNAHMYPPPFQHQPWST